MLQKLERVKIKSIFWKSDESIKNRKTNLFVKNNATMKDSTIIILNIDSKNQRNL